MTSISEVEFAKLCQGIYDDRESIIKHNPIGPPEEILLWMLLSCLISYLNLSEGDTAHLTGNTDVKTFGDAILFVLKDRRVDGFDPGKYLRKFEDDN